jgi:hypothetical protein
LHSSAPPRWNTAVVTETWPTVIEGSGLLGGLFPEVRLSDNRKTTQGWPHSVRLRCPRHLTDCVPFPGFGPRHSPPSFVCWLTVVAAGIVLKFEVRYFGQSRCLELLATATNAAGDCCRLPLLKLPVKPKQQANDVRLAVTHSGVAVFVPPSLGARGGYKKHYLRVKRQAENFSSICFSSSVSISCD